MIRRTGTVAVAVACFGLAGFFFLSWRSAIGPIERPNPATFSPESVATGESLAAAGHCLSCHIRPGGQPYAGGYGVNTPFGIIYGTNITADPETGIGRWSLEAFDRAMREGVSRDGSHLFAAFPYNAFTKLSDDDVKALYAYLMTRPAVSSTVPRNSVWFPLGIRLFQEGWKILFFKSGRYQPNPAKSPEWNRGAYLVEALADCGGCHTPRNAFGGEKPRYAYSGTVVDNWIAPPLTNANPSPIPWTRDELFSYLREGVTPLHGATAATMTPVIRNALALSIVPDRDVRAIAIYFSDINYSGASRPDVQSMLTEAIAASSLGSGQEYDPDANLYAAACMSCHYNSGTVPISPRPELALTSSLTLPEPTNFIQVVLRGVGDTEGAPSLVMPAYASSLSDADVARLAAYLRRTRTRLPPWIELEKKVAAVRKELTAPN
ncbi:MAG: cytochrome c [Deltaproteobacteria bacterium]|nr:cytochrome c [Deltaproteobacteria bacterium]